MNELTKQTSAKWPAIDAAYSFVLPSYQMLTGRFEAADRHISSLLTIASSLTFAGPILARSIRPEISFTSPWFVCALVVFGMIVLCGLYARMKGNLLLPNPRVLYERSLAKPEWKFKVDALYFAGCHFDANAHAVNVKGNWAIGLTSLLVLEVVLLVAWSGS